MSPARLAARLGRGLSAVAADDNGWTDLHYAAALDWPATARALLAAGARRDARLRTDREPLGVRLLSVLSECGQDRFRLLRRNGATPLHIAAVADAGEAVAVLLEGGADPDVADATSGTPLHYAAAAHSSSAAAVLAA
ncbi:MAG: ankyrin repeat domain-containing protein, partial [Acidobacteria bacterium]|nr:ankyrin repeat domain-containing protein [Acidobacteriota bacterium]